MKVRYMLGGAVAAVAVAGAAFTVGSDPVLGVPAGPPTPSYVCPTDEICVDGKDHSEENAEQMRKIQASWSARASQPPASR